MATTMDYLDAIPGARAALDYVVKQVAAFQRIPGRLQVAKANLVNIKRTAESKGMASVATEAAIAITASDTLQSDFNQASVKVGQVLEELRSAGMLSGTLDTIGNVIDAATQVQGLLNATDDLERTVANTGSQAGVAPSTQGSYGAGFAKYLLYGGIAYLGFWALRKGKGTRKF